MGVTEVSLSFEIRNSPFGLKGRNSLAPGRVPFGWVGIGLTRYVHWTQLFNLT